LGLVGFQIPQVLLLVYISYMPDDTESRITISQFGQSIVRYWPILAALFLIISAGIETRLTVRSQTNTLAEIKIQLEAQATNKAQWQKIGANSNAVSNHESRIEQIERHVTPQAIQKWGEIQSTVEEDHRDLKDHLRNHPNSGPR